MAAVAGASGRDDDRREDRPADGRRSPGHDDTQAETASMRLELVRRPSARELLTVLSPLIALGLTIVAGAIIFALLGINPLGALYVYFIEPLTALVVDPGPDRQGGAADPDRGRPVALLPRRTSGTSAPRASSPSGAIAGSILPVFFPEFAGAARPAADAAPRAWSAACSGRRSRRS